MKSFILMASVMLNNGKSRFFFRFSSISNIYLLKGFVTKPTHNEIFTILGSGSLYILTCYIFTKHSSVGGKVDWGVQMMILYCSHTLRKVHRIASSVMFMRPLQGSGLPTKWPYRNYCFSWRSCSKNTPSMQNHTVHPSKKKKKATANEFLKWYWPMRNDSRHFPSSRGEL